MQQERKTENETEQGREREIFDRTAEYMFFFLPLSYNVLVLIHTVWRKPLHCQKNNERNENNIGSEIHLKFTSWTTRLEKTHVNLKATVEIK